MSLKEKEFALHTHGLVKVVDFMGSDEAVVQMARVSYGQGTKTPSEDRGLIRYLMRHRHTSPFEGCVIKLHLKMPLFVARQWVRHRTASMNEVSARYSEMKEEFYVPDRSEVLAQSKTNKQGSAGELDDLIVKDFIEATQRTGTEEYGSYQTALGEGVAREMARINLPLTLYTEFYWQMNLHNLLHFCSLRSDSHAQKQIRDYSDIILHEIIKEWCPHTYEAFIDYVMEADTFSKQEMKLMKAIIGNATTDPYRRQLIECAPLYKELSKREQDEFIKKLS